MRVALSDDRSEPVRPGMKIALDDDGCAPCRTSPCADGSSDTGVVPEVPVDPGGVYPVLTVRQRSRTGYNDDGIPEFAWADLVTGTAVAWAQRSEFDSEAGFTLVKAKATIGYDGPDLVKETCEVVDGADTHWRVTAVRQSPGLLGMDLVRIDG